MAGKRREEVTERQITGLTHFDKLAALLERLHDDGCARDRAGNRRAALRPVLHAHVALLVQSGLSPRPLRLAASQRTGQRAKETGLPAGLCSVRSQEALASVFDPERLHEIVSELGSELKPIGRDPRLRNVPGRPTAVDGSLPSVLPKLMQAFVS